MDRQLANAEKLIKSDGYELTHTIIEGSLDESDDENRFFTLQEGWTYKFVLVCDNDCTDIDLCIHDENENSIGCDEDSSDFALAEVTPKWTGRFHALIEMYDCSVDPCTYKFAIFGKEE
ncbi:hypothetical protein GCM10009119_40190 [Algoriphagus jejuensis]|uniref:Uncharacterized protein n=2 Tax=Algoriphagus jejuensis TaxID=419934 RepID=A0ABN1N5G8_9BACT